ncbi:uncharacterized protein LOC115980046 [Quercus lobata]|uniref:uncharacterized protein LOC115980046 n=1 Tax=Quercus lobata TaxID=97700 RepID=UPI001247C1A7|nr:uncharacterized protein LOC115980046 [Quercus lobata]
MDFGQNLKDTENILNVKDKKFLDDDGGKLFAIVHVSAKFSYGLIRHCNSDPVMEADVFHGMEECKVGEATSCRYEDIAYTLDQVTITEQHSCFLHCLVGLFPSRCRKPYQEYKSDLFGLRLKSKMKILLKQKICFLTSMQDLRQSPLVVANSIRPTD